jgi:hypothetical protein
VEPPKDYASDLYTLSQQPEFHAIYKLLGGITARYHADLPRKDSEVVAHETSNWVEKILRLVVKDMESEIEVGRMLSTHDPGGDNDGDDRQFGRRTRA